MTLLKRADVRTPVLPKETVAVEGLPGEVIVAGLTLSARLDLHALNARLAKPLPGEDKDAARVRAGTQMVAHTLARCVQLGDGSALYSVEEWDAFGATQPEAALALFYKANGLNGQDHEAEEKN